MSRMVVSGVVVGACLGLFVAVGAEAQVQSDSRATAFSLDLGGTEVAAFTDAVCTATEPATQNGAVSGGAFPDNPLVNLSTGDAGCTADATGPVFNAFAAVDETTAALFPGQNAGDDVAQSVNARCAAQLVCDLDGGLTFVGNGNADAVVIGGEEIPLFEDNPPPNTIFILADPLDTVVLNKQTCTFPSADSILCTVIGTQTQLFTESELLQADAAQCDVQLSNLPDPCRVCTIVVTKAIDVDAFVGGGDVDQDGRVDNGDTVGYVVTATNQADAKTAGTIFDRIPLGMNLVGSSVALDGTGLVEGETFFVEACPGNLTFNGCSATEGSSGSNRTCLRVPLGDLDVDESHTLTFSVIAEDVCDVIGPNVCNVASVGTSQCNTTGAPASIPADKAEAACVDDGEGTQLASTGGGGCSVVAGSDSQGPAAGGLVALGLLFAALGRRRRNR